MEIRIIYLTLYIVMYSVAAWSGWRLSRMSGKFSLGRTLLALLPFIIVFTLNEGLRFGRELDYNNYVEVYRIILTDPFQMYEPLFSAIVKFYDAIGLNFQFFVATMSLSICLGIASLGRVYRPIAGWFLPLAIFFSIQAENLVRWYMAFGVVLIGISCYLSAPVGNRRALLLLVGSVLLSITIHKGLVLGCLVISPIFLLRKRMINPFVSLAVYVAGALLFKQEMGENLQFIFQYINLGTQYEHYADNLDIWLTQGARGSEHGATYLSATYSLFYFMILFGCYYFMRRDKNRDYRYLLAYNLFATGMMLVPFTQPIEIAQRINYLLLFWGSVAGAYTFSRLWQMRRSMTLIMAAVVVAITANMIRVAFSPAFKYDTERLLYVWDARGRESVDIYVVYLNAMDDALE